LIDDGLLELRSQCLKATELGHLFIRNICVIFDAYFEAKAKTFSQTV